MYVLIAHLSNIECISRKYIYVILKPSLTIIFLSFNLSTSIWTSFTVSYFYICKILAIHLFNALSPTNIVSTVTQIRSGIIYHNLLYYFDVHLKLMYSYHLNRSYHIGDILYYVLTTIKFSTFLKVEICILINGPISSFQSSIFHWNTYETSHRVINHSLVGSLRLIHIFIGMYYSTSACTCMMSNFSVIYMYMNLLLIFNTVYVSDIIQVQSHYVPKGKPMRGGLALVNRLSRVGKYQTYTDYG